MAKVKNLLKLSLLFCLRPKVDLFVCAYYCQVLKRKEVLELFCSLLRLLAGSFFHKVNGQEKQQKVLEFATQTLQVTKRVVLRISKSFFLLLAN